MSTLDELQQQLSQAQTELQNLNDIVAPMLARIRDQRGVVDDLTNKVDQLLASSHSPDWHWLLEADNGNSSGAKTAARRQALSKWDLAGDSYQPDTNQTVLRIGMTQGDQTQLERVMEGLNTLLPYLRPGPRGGKFISILEQTLSQYGIWRLVVLEDGVQLVSQVYGREHVKAQFDSLREAVAFVQQHHWYRGPDGK